MLKEIRESGENSGFCKRKEAKMLFDDGTHSGNPLRNRVCPLI